MGGFFTPPKVPTGDGEKYAGVCIKQFPKDTDQGEVVEFLCSNGLPEDKKEDIIFKTRGAVTIRNLDNATSKVLIEAIHGKLNFGRKLYCNGFIPLTPEKPVSEDSSSAPPAISAASTPASIAAMTPNKAESTDSSTAPPANPAASAPAPAPAPSSSPIVTPEKFQLGTQGLPAFNFDETSTNALLRRHSLSLVNRTPPKESLAAEILGTLTPRPDLLRAKAILNEVKDMTDRLSDFGSCVSESSGTCSDDSGDESDIKGGFQTMNEKKRNKKTKRKLKLTPGKEQFLKKPNLVQDN